MVERVPQAVLHIDGELPEVQANSSANTEGGQRGGTTHRELGGRGATSAHVEDAECLKRRDG